MKKLLAVTAILLAILLAGCRSSAAAAEVSPAQDASGGQPAAQQTAAQETVTADDGEVLIVETLDAGDSGEAPYVTWSATLMQDGREQPVYVTVSSESIVFFSDESRSFILGYADIPKEITGLDSAEIDVHFVDLDHDGWSDVVMDLTYPDADTTASLLWIWEESQGYAFNREFSRMPGETGAAG